jgi:hypothetical protein
MALNNFHWQVTAALQEGSGKQAQQAVQLSSRTCEVHVCV